MGQYNHITLKEREKIFFLKATGLKGYQIAKKLGRHKTTIYRELRRNTTGNEYSPSKAQEKYRERRKECHPKRKILDDYSLFLKISDMFLLYQWSPEEIANRIKAEKGKSPVSRSTIYRAIYAGYFDEVRNALYNKVREGKKNLRRKGKKRKKSNDPRGVFPVSNELSERPAAANNRERIGDWEGDTVVGKKGKSCLATYVDRKSRFLICAKAAKKDAECVNAATIKCLKDCPLESITVDRGAEFKRHHEVTEALQVDYYFPKPYSPWERGTNENTNGLLREYFPKGTDFDKVTEEEVQEAVDKLNYRPRKCLGYRTPYEVFYGVVLHLV